MRVTIFMCDRFVTKGLPLGHSGTNFVQSLSIAKVRIFTTAVALVAIIIIKKTKLL